MNETEKAMQLIIQLTIIEIRQLAIPQETKDKINNGLIVIRDYFNRRNLVERKG